MISKISAKTQADFQGFLMETDPVEFNEEISEEDNYSANWYAEIIEGDLASIGLTPEVLAKGELEDIDIPEATLDLVLAYLDSQDIEELESGRPVDFTREDLTYTYLVAQDDGTVRVQVSLSYGLGSEPDYNPEDSPEFL